MAEAHPNSPAGVAFSGAGGEAHPTECVEIPTLGNESSPVGGFAAQQLPSAARRSQAVPRYFLHLYDSGGICADEEGHDLPTLAAARSMAIAGIRSILAEDVMDGRLGIGGRIVIMDTSSHVLATVGFNEALEIDTDVAKHPETGNSTPQED